MTVTVDFAAGHSFHQGHGESLLFWGQEKETLRLIECVAPYSSCTTTGTGDAFNLLILFYVNNEKI